MPTFRTEYLSAKAPVGPHLCDQLLMPMAIAGGGGFVTTSPTQHTRTNITVIEEFLGDTVALTDLGEQCWRVSVSA